MRKLLLSLFAVGIIASLSAQQAKVTKQVSKNPSLAKGLQVKAATLEAEPTTVYPYNPYNIYVSTKGAKGVHKVGIGSSANPFGVLLASQNCLTYCPELDLIMFTHRQNHTNTGNSGYIQTTFSTDGGLSWNNNIVYQDASKFGRYPSGVVYNPAGNTNIDNAYAVVAGPYTDGSGWKGNFHASMKFDGTGGDKQQLDDANIGYTNLVRNHMDLDSQGRIRIYGEKNTDDGTYYTGYNTAIYTGTFNAGVWTWQETNVIPEFTVGTNNRPSGYRSPGMAWSKDGETGYLVYVGRSIDAIDTDAYHPMIYKTVDAGATWALQPGFDWTNIPAIYDELTETQDGITKRAIFSLIEDAIVDADGYLHFASYINSAYSTHPDSLGYYYAWQGIEGIMYHCWETSTGWTCDYIDIQWGKDVDDADCPIGIGWDNRLQMSKTPDEEKIVFAWLDTDTVMDALNLYPDIITQVYNIATGVRSASKNLTKGTSYDGFNYFMYLSSWSGYDAANNEVIPHITTSSYGTTDSEPVYHYYLQTGPSANINDPVAQNNNHTFVSQNYPNPFNGSTSIDIVINKSTNVFVEITNMLGQKVSETTENLNAGTHTLLLNAENLKTGIYFYTVRAGENVVTHKMIIK